VQIVQGAEEDQESHEVVEEVLRAALERPRDYDDEDGLRELYLQVVAAERRNQTEISDLRREVEEYRRRTDDLETQLGRLREIEESKGTGSEGGGSNRRGFWRKLWDFFTGFFY
jgi:hypothetical protein